MKLEQQLPTEHQVPAEQRSPGDLAQAPHGQNADDQAQQLREAVARPSEEPTAHRPDDEPMSRDASPSALILNSPTQRRDDAIMGAASQPLSAEDIKKRLLQVLRHLRDTAAVCRQIPDLDRNFSNMLKSTYKTLYDSLKEVTPSKAAGRPAPAAGAAAAAATGGRSSENGGRNSSQAAGAKKAAAGASTGAAAAPAVQAASDPPFVGAEPAAAGTARTRDLSALARLVHAKRLHQQADGGAAARDADQPPARRPARVPTPATSAGARLPTLYDGLPPARVLPAPGHATPETAAEAAEPQPLPQALETAAATGQGAGRVSGAAPLREATLDASGTGTEAGRAPEPASSSAPAEGTSVRGIAARQGAGGRSDGAGGGGGGQAAVSPPCSPSQQLLEQARASGGEVARSLLLRTAQPPAGCENPSPSEAPQSHGRPQGDGGGVRGGAAAASAQAAMAARGPRGGGGQQRAKRALELEPIAAGSDRPLEPASASKRPHTGI
ncbi:hypothetical protein PLESTF_000271100 [Pleodorina starrii]|nr:hypothetical protein PLESTM_001222300 [Pleodorina starrii]GLC65273.1 hypothetical protein PLESTF_000271100 [Pleodorina starrii]